MISRNRWAPTFVLVAMVIATLLWAFPLLAQQQNPASADTSSQGQSKTGEKSADNKDPAIQEQKSPKNGRLFYVLPNYLTVENSKHIPSLTTGQKFKLVALGTFDPVEYPYVGVLTLIDQAENTDPSFRQGFVGYAKRYGAAYADTTIENFAVGAVFPLLLHQDPRYFQSGEGGFYHANRFREKTIQLLRVGRQCTCGSTFQRLPSAARPECPKRRQYLGDAVMGRCGVL
ncbi:MAG: hypothetical protein ACLQVM_24160 [Terriglobia bacterium]